MQLRGATWLLTLLVGPSMAAAQGDAELSCVPGRTAADDALILYEMGRRSEPRDTREDEAMNRFADEVGWCQARHGWSGVQAVAAIQYTLGRAAYMEAAERLVERGFAPGFLDQVVADLGEEGMAMLRSGDERPENLEFVGGVVSRRIRESGVSIADREDLSSVGRIVARGVRAISVRDGGAAAFASG